MISFSALKAPSSSVGQVNALKRVATGDPRKGPLWCSSNSTAIHVVALLFPLKPDIEQKYLDAAASILTSRSMLEETDMEGVMGNEHFYTGSFCDALNIVKDPSYCFLHQACIGDGFTHSDVSGRHYLSGTYGSTLLVGEAKGRKTAKNLDEHRGQLFNELIRHRKIDEEMTKESVHRPILLLSFNYSFVSLELAFPSTKGGRMEATEWVEFDETVKKGSETFWTVPVALVCIKGGSDESKHKLARVLRFITDTMKYLNNMEDLGRVQTKTPWLEPGEDKARKAGDNVTITTSASGSQKVFKEFCYYLRETDGLNYVPEKVGAGDDFLPVKVEEVDQRIPPPRDLLTKLGEPYQSWKIKEYAGGRIKVLEYNFIEGNHWPFSTKAWIMVLKQVEIVHSLGFVHGDLLPRNLIFSGEDGYVIDFDLMRKENVRYVSGYDNAAFPEYRHREAMAGEKMKKEHDVWALACMTKIFFDITAAEDCTTLSDLKAVFVNPRVKPIEAEMVDSNATGSPERRGRRIARKKRKRSRRNQK